MFTPGDYVVWKTTGSDGRYRVLGNRYQRYHVQRYRYRLLTWYRSILSILAFLGQFKIGKNVLRVNLSAVENCRYQHILGIETGIGIDRYQCSKYRYRYRIKNPGIAQH